MAYIRRSPDRPARRPAASSTGNPFLKFASPGARPARLAGGSSGGGRRGKRGPVKVAWSRPSGWSCGQPWEIEREIRRPRDLSDPLGELPTLTEPEVEYMKSGYPCLRP